MRAPCPLLVTALQTIITVLLLHNMASAKFKPLITCEILDQNSTELRKQAVYLA